MPRITLLSIIFTATMISPLQASRGPEPDESMQQNAKAKVQHLDPDFMHIRLGGCVNMARGQCQSRESVEEMRAFLTDYLGAKTSIEPAENSIELATAGKIMPSTMEEVE